MLTLLVVAVAVAVAVAGFHNERKPNGPCRVTHCPPGKSRGRLVSHQSQYYVESG